MKKVVIKEYLSSITLITANDSYIKPYTFAYFVENKLKNKCFLSTFRNIMVKNLIASPWALKKTRKTYKKLIMRELKQVKNKDERKQLKEIMNMTEKFYLRISCPEHEGQECEVDASKDYWLDSKYSHLYVAYDPAIRHINSLHLEKEETTTGYYQLFKPIIKSDKIHKKYKGDKRSSFVINKKDAGH